MTPLLEVDGFLVEHGDLPVDDVGGRPVGVIGPVGYSKKGWPSAVAFPLLPSWARSTLAVAVGFDAGRE